MINEKGEIKLNLGSSSIRSEGWSNVDLIPGQNVDLTADIRYLYQMPKKVASIRASHILEHIPANEVVAVLRRWKFILEESGTLIIGVPNFEYVIRHITENPRKFLHFWEKSFDPSMLIQIYGSFFEFRDDENNKPFQHRMLFTPDSLKTLLEHVGFIDVTQFVPNSPEDNRAM